MRHCRLGLIYLLTLLSACGGTDGNAGRASRATAPLVPASRDSAGVVIHEIAPDALSHAPELVFDSLPVYQYVGSISDTARDISSLVYLTFLSDGRLVALDQDRGTLAVLDSNGTIHRFGRRGAGPLELGDSPSLVVTPRDTILLTDRANNRFVVASPDSGLLRTIALSNASGLDGYGVLGRTSDGLFLLNQTGLDFGAGRQPGIVRPEFAFATWRPGGSPPVERFRYPYWLMKLSVIDLGQGRMGQSMRSLALTDAPVVLAGHDGFVSTPATKWQIEQRDTTGALRSIIRMPLRRVAVDDRIWGRYVDRFAKARIAARPDLDADSLREVFAGQQHADSLPAIERLDLSPDGKMWVYDATIPGDSGWGLTVLDRAGRVLGRHEASGGPRPLAFGNGVVLFRTEDDNGIATLTVRRVRFPR